MNNMCYSHIRNSMLWNRERRLKSCWESIKNDESFTSLIYLLIITTCFVDNKYNFKEGVSTENCLSIIMYSTPNIVLSLETEFCV